MIGTFFDTEATGLPDWRGSSIAVGQPTLVQLAALQIDISTWTIRQAVNLIVYPDEWEIPEEAAAIHGITTETARNCGLLLESVVGIFCDLIDRSDFLAAHNLDYDKLVMERAAAMCCVRKGVDVVTPWPDHLKMTCTKKLATPIVKARKNNPMHAEDWKWPSLEECSQHFWQRGVEGAHDAWNDVRVCADVFYQLWADGHIDPYASQAAA